MTSKLTSHQEQILTFIRDYITRNKHSPYLREIQQGCNIQSHKVVIDRLNALERKCYIKRKLSQHRGIRLLNHKGNILNNTGGNSELGK